MRWMGFRCHVWTGPHQNLWARSVSHEYIQFNNNTWSHDRLHTGCKLSPWWWSPTFTVIISDWSDWSGWSDWSVRLLSNFSTSCEVFHIKSLDLKGSSQVSRADEAPLLSLCVQGELHPCGERRLDLLRPSRLQGPAVHPGARRVPRIPEVELPQRPHGILQAHPHGTLLCRGSLCLVFIQRTFVVPAGWTLRTWALL